MLKAVAAGSGESILGHSARGCGIVPTSLSKHDVVTSSGLEVVRPMHVLASQFASSLIVTSSTSTTGVKVAAAVQESSDSRREEGVFINCEDVDGISRAPDSTPHA